MAKALRKYEFKKGDVLTIVARNHEELTPVVIAALCLGCPVNALDITFSETEINHLLQIARPKAVFCDCDVIGVVKKSLRNVNSNARIFTFRGSDDQAIAVSDILTEECKEDEYDLKYVSSGHSQANYSFDS